MHMEWTDANMLMVRTGLVMLSCAVKRSRLSTLPSFLMIMGSWPRTGTMSTEVRARVSEDTSWQTKDQTTTAGGRSKGCGCGCGRWVAGLPGCLGPRGGRAAEGGAAGCGAALNRARPWQLGRTAA